MNSKACDLRGERYKEAAKIAKNNRIRLAWAVVCVLERAYTRLRLGYGVFEPASL